MCPVPELRFVKRSCCEDMCLTSPQSSQLTLDVCFGGCAGASPGNEMKISSSRRPLNPAQSRLVPLATPAQSGTENGARQAEERPIHS